MVMVLLAIIAAVGSTVLSGGFDAYFAERDMADAAAQGRLALARLTRDLRSVRSPSTADLTISPATQISLVDSTGATVAYALTGTTLTRNGQALADGISNLNFAYIGNDGKTTAAAITDVYYIGASFTISQGNANQNWRALIHPRNFP